jgi:hypothetical protein
LIYRNVLGKALAAIWPATYLLPSQQGGDFILFLTEIDRGDAAKFQPVRGSLQANSVDEMRFIQMI